MRLRTIGGVIVLGVLALTATLRASDMVGVYGIIEKVVLEALTMLPRNVRAEIETLLHRE